MNKKLTQIALAFLATTGVATAQSDGRSFDAAVVLAPGMTLERYDNLYGNNWSNFMLQDGDILRAEGDGTGEPYLILTTDGSVIAMAAGSMVTIEGARTGFSVFQTTSGKTWIAGNIYRGFVLPDWFRSRVPSTFGNTVVYNNSYDYPFYPNGYTSGYVYNGYDMYPNGYGGYNAYANIVTLPWGSTFTIPGLRTIN